MDFAEKLKKFREFLGYKLGLTEPISQEKLSRLMGVSQRSISWYETGRSRPKPGSVMDQTIERHMQDQGFFEYLKLKEGERSDQCQTSE
jgi:transcriptional regulator with XRE-family HTH domain